VSSWNCTCSNPWWISGAGQDPGVLICRRPEQYRAYRSETEGYLYDLLFLKVIQLGLHGLRLSLVDIIASEEVISGDLAVLKFG
jgi:hypothetical protein